MSLRGKPGPLRARTGRRGAPLETASELAEAVRPRQTPPTPTLASIVQQKIVSDIAHGALPPGSRLEEEELACRYHVSRTPVREALRQLSALGILEMRHRQGVVVASRSVEHFQNLLEIVADLEASAARYAAQRMTQEERQKLQALHDHIGGIAAQVAVTRFDKANAQLHQMIHEGAHNKILLNGIVQMRMRTLPYTRMEFISERRRMEISHMEHNAIVSAIMRREAEMAYHAMRLHVIDAGQVQEDKVKNVLF
jgi:DNA-binding GntR family transcriptional regulator